MSNLFQNKHYFHKYTFCILIIYSLILTKIAAKPDETCLKAYELAKKNQFSQALSIINQNKYTTLTKYIKWKKLRYKHNKATFKEHYNFIKENKSWPFLYEIKQNMESKNPIEISDKKLKQWFSKEFPTTLNGIILYTNILKKYKLDNKANKIIRSFWINNLRNLKESEKFYQAYKNILTSIDHKVRIQKLLWEGNVDLAEPLLKHLKKNQRTIAEIRIALIKNDKTKIPNILPNFILKYKKNEGILYDITKWHRRFNENKAINIYIKVRPYIKTYINEWVKEKHIIVRDAIRNKEYNKAYKLVSNHIFENGKNFAEAEWLSGFISHKFLNRHSKAIIHFEKLLKILKKSTDLSQAAFWGAKAQEKLGNNKLKISWLKKAAQYSTTYYGQLACEELNIKDYIKFKKTSNIPTSYLNKIQSNEFFEIIKMLKILNDSSKSLPFLYLMLKRAKNYTDKIAIIELSRIYSPENVIELLDSTEQEKNSILKWSYPTLKNIKWRNGINKHLIHAIIRKESKFNPKATSWVGARGIMQIMPKTGEFLAKELKIKNFKPSQLYEKNLNLTFGQFYVEELLKLFNDNIIIALAAYNAGPGNVERKWLPKFGDPVKGEIDEITWVELIPFSQTRFYIMKVIAYYQIYKKINKELFH